MKWVQPALGQAIVDDYLLERAVSSKTAQAAAEFGRAALASLQLENAPFGYLERIGTHAASVEADHAARIQFVLGRRIVGFTARGVRMGVLSPTQLTAPYNRRMIRMAELGANRMEDDFLSNRQTLLGWEIVIASQGHAQIVGQAQHRLGDAIVRVTQVQQVYGEAMAGAQEQLAATALASIHTEQLADRFARLAAADLSGGGKPIAFTEPRSWPEVPVGLLLAASAMLIGLFFAGLSMPSIRREHEIGMEAMGEGEGQAESAETVYRKTA
ncbi:MAG: hypothetical protein EPO64_12095 [Nitrospirae bacterium]|nr:MAG: hypothetical protein EPO64_12095 [Nitrospirota bacterium]